MLWNIFAEEANKKTLVWHWPGSSWPPTSDSENLHVVDGAQPASVNYGVGIVDIVKYLEASEDYAETEFIPNNVHLATGTGCVIEDLDELLDMDHSEESAIRDAIKGNAKQGFSNIIASKEECEVYTISNAPKDYIKSTIKPAKGWENSPEDSKEFTIILSKGLIRRPALILKNSEGIYDTVEIYKSKKEVEPFLSLKNGEVKYNVSDEVFGNDGAIIPCIRSYVLRKLSPDGSALSMIIEPAGDVANDSLFHPKNLLREVVDNIGAPPMRSGAACNDPELAKIFVESWDNYNNWQADCLTYFMENKKYDIIFSHLHNIDSCGHNFWHYGKYQEEWGNDENKYHQLIENVYTQTDNYIGRFMPYLEQEWTIIITSDHGLITSEHHGILLGEMCGVNVPIMRELGYTELLKDENGNDMREIDWSKTKAVAIRGNHIYINLKGRNPSGIVHIEDKYRLEEEIISALYNYRDPETGKRVISIALRNKDAALFGMSGSECGDIIYFKEEGFNVIHCDSLSTQEGYFNTSVSPIFVAAGPGIKKNFVTNRVIRQVDIAPTLAVLGGVRMPAHCEGAPVYQILTEEF